MINYNLNKTSKNAECSIKSLDCLEKKKCLTKININIYMIEQILHNLKLIIFILSNNNILNDNIFDYNFTNDNKNNSKIYLLLNKIANIFNKLINVNKLKIILDDYCINFKNCNNDIIKQLDLSLFYLIDRNNYTISINDNNLFNNDNKLNCKIFLSKIIIFYNNINLLKKYIC